MSSDQPMRAAVLTASDSCSRGEREDLSGPVLVERLKKIGFQVVETALAEDDIRKLTAELTRLSKVADLVVTTGGTGLSPRDVTPEATKQIIDREVPGLSVRLLQEGMARTPLASLSRGIAGLRGSTLIVNLPGSVRAVEEGLDALEPVLPHAVRIATGRTGHHD